MHGAHFLAPLFRISRVSVLSESKWTQPNRLTQVTSHRLVEEVVGSSPFVRIEQFSGKKGFENTRIGDTIWTVWTTCLTGLDKETLGCSIFASEREAREAIDSMPVGTIYGDGFGWPFRFREMLEGKDNAAEIMSTMFFRSDECGVDQTCYEALFEAGVHEKKFGELSMVALDWLGDEHIAWMQDEFRENWEFVAAFEYVLNHFPDSSLVGLAARLFLARFVISDDFAAGYLVKEIEAISGGTEAAALSSVEAKRKAGKSGGHTSRQRRLRNLEVVMKEIENLADAVHLFSEERVVEQAFEAASARTSEFPRSQKTQNDYATALRSEQPFKSRYEAVFRKNA